MCVVYPAMAMTFDKMIRTMLTATKHHVCSLEQSIMSAQGKIMSAHNRETSCLPMAPKHHVCSQHQGLSPRGLAARRSTLRDVSTEGGQAPCTGLSGIDIPLGRQTGLLHTRACAHTHNRMLLSAESSLGDSTWKDTIMLIPRESTSPLKCWWNRFAGGLWSKGANDKTPTVCRRHCQCK